MQDVLLDEQFEGTIEVIAVDTLDEVMEHALITHEQKQSWSNVLAQSSIV